MMPTNDELDEALDVVPQYARAVIRAALAAKDAEIARLRQRPRHDTVKRYKKYLEDELLRKRAGGGDGGGE